MADKNSGRKSGGSQPVDQPEETGIPLGTSVNPGKKSHQQGNRGAGVFNWRAGRGAV